jgi:hypothetical protein
MRFLLVLLLALVLPATALEWRNDEFGCSANVPDSAGWTPIQTENAPGLVMLITLQNPAKNAYFGINVLRNLPSANLKDPATITALEGTLRAYGYQFIGRSSLVVGGREWVQFPVRTTNGGQTLAGLVRYTSANNQVYGVNLLRGGGQDAAQDPELQAAAASVRITSIQAVPAVPAAPVAAAPVTAPPPSPGATTPAPVAVTPPSSVDGDAREVVKIGPLTLTQKQVRMGIYGAAGLLVLIILLKIVGGSGTPTKR